MSDERKHPENQSLEPAARLPRPMATDGSHRAKMSQTQRSLHVQTYCTLRSRRCARRRPGGARLLRCRCASARRRSRRRSRSRWSVTAVTATWSVITATATVTVTTTTTATRHGHHHHHHHHHHHRHRHHHHRHCWHRPWPPLPPPLPWPCALARLAPVLPGPGATRSLARLRSTCTCLVKEYLPNGAVLFRDVCTNELAMNPPAQAAEVPPQGS